MSSWRGATRLRGDGGFSLIEVMIASAVFSLILAGSYKVVVTTQETSIARGLRNAVRQNARVAANRLVSDARMAGYKLKGLPEAIPEAGADYLRVVGDVDIGSDAAPCLNESANPDPNSGVEQITYQVLNGQLQRRVECWDGVAWVMETDFVELTRLDDVTYPTTFRYYDNDGFELMPAGGRLTALQKPKIARIGIELHSLDPDAVDQVGDLTTLNEYYVKIDFKVRNRTGL